MLNDVSEIIWIKVAVPGSICNHEICLEELKNTTTNLSHRTGSYQINAKCVITKSRSGKSSLNAVNTRF
jgi:hypothetical protein